MEAISVILDNSEEFDKAVQGGLPDAGDVRMISKSGLTREGNPGVVITFTVQLPDQELAQAKSVVTLRQFLMAAAALRGRHGEP